MSEAYRIRRYHHVTGAKHDRLREERLIPLLERLSGHDLIESDIDDLMKTDEVMNLHMDDIDTLEEQLNIIQNIMPGDWLIDISEDGSTVYLAKYHGYVRHPHRHLFIKHFAQVGPVYEVSISDLPSDILLPATSARHLQTLPLTLSALLDKFDQVASNSIHIPPPSYVTPSAQGTRTARPRGRPSKNGPVIVRKTISDPVFESRIPDLNMPSFTKSRYTGHSLLHLNKNKTK